MGMLIIFILRDFMVVDYKSEVKKLGFPNILLCAYTIG